MNADLDLENVRRHVAEYDELWNKTPPAARASQTRMTMAALLCAEDVPALLAEIDRLRNDPPQVGM